MVGGAEPFSEWFRCCGGHSLECELCVGIELHGSRLDGCEWGQPHRRCRAVEWLQLEHPPHCGDRPSFRPTHQRPVPLARQLLGRRQCRARGTDAELPAGFSWCDRRPGADRALGRIGLVERTERDRAGAQRRLSKWPRVRRRHRLLGLGRDDRRHRDHLGDPYGGTGTVPRGPIHRCRCPTPRRRGY